MTHELLLTAVVVASLIAINYLLASVQATRGSLDFRRKSLVLRRNSLVLLGGLGLIAIWSEELHAVLVTLMAFGAALLVVNKELVLSCVTSIVTTGGQFGGIGDLVLIRGLRGRVIDRSLVYTVLREVGETSAHYTGREIVVPNALFVQEAFTLDAAIGEFTTLTLTIPSSRETWPEDEAQLLSAALSVVQEYQEKASAEWERYHDSRALDPMSSTPRVVLQLGVDPKQPEVQLILRMPAPAIARVRVEQQVIRQYLLSKREIGKA